MRPEPPNLVQLVPPGPGGVRDYVTCLQAEWQRLGTPTQVIELSRELTRERSLADRLSDGSSDGTATCSVVLHYSGYGYGQRGLCFWLLDELRALRARCGDGLRLVVVFHELYASGPPWRSAFWLSPMQALIAARLARLADALWTNTAQHAQWLNSGAGAATPMRVRPVFSNVGECNRPPAFAERLPQAIVFGSPSTRQRAFDALRPHEPTLRRLGIDALIEVGPGAASTGLPTTLPCRHAGRLEHSELGRLLLQSRYGLLDYPSQLLGKSGVLAAYAAHGCVALDTRPPGPDTDGLVAGRDYLALDALPGAAWRPDPAALATMASALAAWYAGHRLARQAQELLALARD